MSLFIALRSELLKTRRTASLYLALAAAAFAPFMSLLDLLVDGVEADHKADILNELFTTKFLMTTVVAYPIFLILVCTLLPQTEYRNHTWKQVFTAPQRKANVFFAKFINVQLLLFIFLTANLVLMFLCAVILHFKEPELHVLQQPLNGYDVLMYRVNSYLALMAVCAIQFWLGLRFKNFIIPVAMGVALWFTGTLLVLEKLHVAAYFPYSFHAYGKFPKYDPGAGSVTILSLAFTLLFIAVAYFDFRREGWSK